MLLAIDLNGLLLHIGELAVRRLGISIGCHDD